MLRAVLIDDSADLRLLTRLTLEFEAHAEIVGEAADGQAGLGLIEQLSPDVAVIDLHMPGMDGVELIRLLRSRAGVTRLVVYSSDDAGLSEAIGAGADAAVLRTADVNALVAAIGGG